MFMMGMFCCAEKSYFYFLYSFEHSGKVHLFYRPYALAPRVYVSI